MSKKVAIASIILFVLIAIHVSNVIAAVKDNEFFYTNKQEMCQGETLEMTLDISKIKYDKFEFKLTSNLETDNIVINEDIKVENYNNDINISIDKAKINLDKITFYYKVPENAQVGTKIELETQIIAEKEMESNDTNAKTIEEKKKIEVKIVEKKQESNIQNEQNIIGSNNEIRNSKENENININANKSIQSKVQNTNYSGSTINIGNSVSAKLETETAIYKGSSNNYLSSLEIEGVSLNTTFNKEKTTYFIETTGKTELKVNTEKEDSTSKVYITGNENLKTGDNKILISVTAENGDVRYYRIFVTNK